MPHTLLAAGTKQADVNRVVREVLQGRGAILDEMTQARTVFEGVEVEGGFRRGGYVGAYQPLGAAEVEVLLEVWATAPRRAFWGVAAVELALVVVLLVGSLPSAAFFWAGLAMWAALGAAGALYYLTFRGSMALEDELHAALAAALQGAGIRVVGEAEQLERQVRERLEGEVKARELGPLPRVGRRAPAGAGAAGAAAEGAEAPAPAKRGLFGKRPPKA